MPRNFEFGTSLALEDELSDSAHPSAAAQAVISRCDEVTQIPTVLLVDDDYDSLVLLEHILHQFTCHIVCKSDGQAALAYAQQNPPDLILLDIWLVDISGLDVVHALKQLPITQAIPIVAVTALAQQSDRREILQAGCTHYISKPYLIEDMEALLRQYLEWQAD